MKILIINYEYPPLGGGGGVFTKDLAEELAKDHTVDVLTSGFKELASQEAIKGVNIYRVAVLARKSSNAASLLSLLSFPFSSVIKGIQLIRKNKYDVINTHFAVPTGPTGLVLSWIFKIPNILSIHGGDIYDPSKNLSPHRHGLLRWIIRRVMAASNKIIAQSNNTKNNAIEIYKPLKDIAIIPLGIPEPKAFTASRKDLSLKENETYIISIGRLVKRKGYDHLLNSISILRDKGIHVNVLIVGDGPELMPLQELAKDLGIKGQAKFLTNVTDEEKFSCLLNSDLYALSSLHEGFGIVLLEAMFAGLPIVATNNGGQTDLLISEVNALLVPPEDDKALADAIEKILNDTEKREIIARNNLEKIKDFTISSVTKKYLDVFREVTKK